MSLTKGELAQLRGQYSDDQILDNYTHYAPEYASDIGALQKQGLNSSQILDGLADYTEATAPKQSWADTVGNFLKAPAYGAADELDRAAATEKDVLGATTAANMEHGAAQGLRALIGTYEPAAPQFDVTTPSTWSYAPRAVMESLPSTAGYLAAGGIGGGLGGPVGALVGAGLYGLHRYWGKDAEARAANNGRNEPTTQDIVEALPGAVSQGALDAAGSRALASNALLKALPIKGAGVPAIAQTGVNVLKTGAVNAATGAASDLAGQLGTTAGTDRGTQVNPEEALNSAGLSGLTAAGLKTLHAVPETANSIRFADGDPEAKGRIADLINGPRVAGDPNDPWDTTRILKTTGELLGNDVTKATSGLQASVRDAASQGVDTGSLRSALDTVRDLKANLDTGYPLDPGQLADLRANPAVPTKLVETLADLSEFNRLSRTVQGAASAPQGVSALDVVNGLLKAKKLAALAGLGVGVAAHSTPLGLGVAALPYVARMASKVVDAARGNTNPLGEYVTRFQGLGQGQPQAVTATARQSSPDLQQAPLVGQLMPPAPVAGLLPAPAIRLGAPSVTHGANFVSWPSQDAGQQNAAPQAPLALPAPMKALPSPEVIYGPDQIHGPWWFGKRGPGFTMRASEEPAQAAVQAPQEAPQAPPQAVTPELLQRATEASQRPQASQNTESPVSAGQVIGGKQARAVPQARSTVNQQADLIEGALKRAQAVLSDPSASPEAREAARLTRVKAVMAAASMHEATNGGRKSAKGAQFFGGDQGPAEARHGPKATTADTFEIHTPSGTRVQEVADVRRTREGVAAGVLKRESARREILEGAKALPLSPHGKVMLERQLPRINSELFHNATNQVEAAERLTGALKGLGEKDRGVLKRYFESATASNGLSLLATWKLKGTRSRKGPQIDA